MVEIDGILINPAHVVSAEIEQRFYANGSASYLIVKLSNGHVIRREHGHGFDVYAAHKALASSQAQREGQP